jgi:hypothetical protein
MTFVFSYITGAAPDVHFPGMMVASGHYMAPAHQVPPAAFSLVPPGVTAVPGQHPNALSIAAPVASTALSSTSSSANIQLLSHHQYMTADNSRMNGSVAPSNVQHPHSGDSPPSSSSIAGVPSSLAIDQKSARVASTPSLMAGSRYPSLRIAVSENRTPNAVSDGRSPSSTDSGSTSPATTPSSGESANYHVRTAADVIGAAGNCSMKSEVV